MKKCRSAWSVSRKSARITRLPGTIGNVPAQVLKMAPAAGPEVRRCRRVSAGVCFQFCFQNTCSFPRQPARLTSLGHEEQTASAASSTSTGWWPELGGRGFRHQQRSHHHRCRLGREHGHRRACGRVSSSGVTYCPTRCRFWTGARYWIGPAFTYYFQPLTDI